MTVSLIIMAAGQSRRMMQNKLFLTYNGQTFIEGPLSLALKMTETELILVISSVDVMKIVVPNRVKVVINNQPEKGQSHSVSLGTNQAVGKGYLFLPIDQPLLRGDVLKAILEKASETNIVIPESAGKLGSPVYFGRKFRQELLEVKGPFGGRSVRDGHPEAWVKVTVPGELLKDIDCQEDYLALIKYMSKSSVSS